MNTTHTYRKKWGQHFLTDPNLLRRIVQTIDPQPEDRILEIGPGEGALTKIIFPRVAGLAAVEIDPWLVERLLSDESLKGCEVIQEDVLNLKLSTLPLAPTLRVVGNLPYNITTPILFWLIGQLEDWQDAHLMVQKEVGERMMAEPGTKTYSRLSVMIQAFLEGRACFTIPPEVFIPRPRVESLFLRLQPLSHPAVPKEGFSRFQKIVTAAFAQRRKMLKNSLSGFHIPDRLQQEIDFSRRPETLTVQEFARLSKSRV